MADLPVLTVTIDWKPGLVERWQWKTDVMLAWDGGEQRRQIRATPRVELEAESLLGGSEAASFKTWLAIYQAAEFAIPYWPAGEDAPHSLAARFLEPVEWRWPAPTVARASLRLSVTSALSAPVASVRVYDGFEVLDYPPPDFRRPRTDAWRRLQEILDYQSGPITVHDRSGFVRRRWGIDYLFADAAEIQAARAFFWNRAGQAKLAWFPAPEGGYALARLDGDELEWRWISPGACRLSVGVLTEMDTNYVEIPLEPPVADFTIHALSFSPMSVSFNDASAGIIGYRIWDFGDGGSSLEPNPTHGYAYDGDFSVTLTAVGPGGSGSVMKTIPLCEISFWPRCGTSPLTPTFTALVDGIAIGELADLPPTVSGLTWNFGDGNTSTDASPSNTYTDLGSYDPYLTVHRTDGPDTVVRVGAYSAMVIVNVHANFTANGYSSSFSVGPPVTVVLDNSSTGTIDSVLWNLPDGTSDASVPVPFTLSSTGTFPVTLSVYSPCGGVSTKSISITVTP